MFDASRHRLSNGTKHGKVEGNIDWGILTKYSVVVTLASVAGKVEASGVNLDIFYECKNI